MASNLKEKPEISSGNVLMDLRIVILKTIARVWDDDKKSHDTISERLNKIEFPENYQQRLLENKWFKEHWKDPTSLRDILTHFEPEFLNEYFNRVFGYCIPFENFGVRFEKGSATWNAYGDDEWTKPETETISLMLPSCEDSWDPYQKANYLMQFYSFFPSFFGSKRRKKEEHSENKLSRAELYQDASSEFDATDFSGNDYNLGVAEDEFLSFGALINKVIAVAWNNPKFKSAIDYHEHNVSDEIYYKRVASILKEHFDFQIQWAFNIKLEFSKKHNLENTNEFSDSRAPFWTLEEKQWRWFEGSKNRQVIRNSVSLEIPVAPDGPEENVSLALARYNLIGPAYPFTCS